MVDPTGSMQLVKSYETNVNVLNSSGDGTTTYGFDGEPYDSYINLLNLRARELNTAIGRFLTRDTWQGNEQQPASYNKWLFTYANPVNLSDPTGYYSTSEIKRIFNVDHYPMIA
jgi:RHS repeat-associated protein